MRRGEVLRAPNGAGIWQPAHDGSQWYPARGRCGASRARLERPRRRARFPNPRSPAPR
jgi:hypothetical protein